MKNKLITLKRKIRLIAPALCAMWIATSQAAIIVDDNFSGTAGAPPDPANWVVSSTAVALNGTGSVAIDSIGGFQSMDGVPALSFAPTVGISGELTFANLTGGPQKIILGLTSGANLTGSRIFLRNDIANGSWNIDINDGGAFTYRPLSISEASLGTWTILWSVGNVQAFFDGALQFDSSTDLPTVGDSAWSIPTVAMKPGIGQYGSDILNLDRVVYQSVPEPSLVLLVSCGLLATLVRVSKIRRALA
ncbi:hypothetical protein BH09VER1_BH09VER1_17350 [soil metagenome]